MNNLIEIRDSRKMKPAECTGSRETEEQDQHRNAYRQYVLSDHSELSAKVTNDMTFYLYFYCLQ